MTNEQAKALVWHEFHRIIVNYDDKVKQGNCPGFINALDRLIEQVDANARAEERQRTDQWRLANASS